MVDFLNIKSILGRQGDQRVTCNYTYYVGTTDVHTGTVVTRLNGDNTIASQVCSGTSCSVAATEITADYDNSGSESVCNAVTDFFGSEIIFDYGGAETDDTGIFELDDIVVPVVMTMLLIALLHRAFDLAKNAIKLGDEDEDPKDPRYYYQGADGKTYYGVKKRFRNY